MCISNLRHTLRDKEAARRTTVNPYMSFSTKHPRAFHLNPGKGVLTFDLVFPFWISLKDAACINKKIQED